MLEKTTDNKSFRKEETFYNKRAKLKQILQRKTNYSSLTSDTKQKSKSKQII